MSQLDVYKELCDRGIKLNGKGDVSDFNPNYYPIYIKRNHEIIQIKDKCFYLFNNRAWEKQDAGKVLKILRDIFQEPKFGIWTPSIERDYMVGMQRELYHEADMNPNKNLINLVNGMYDTNTLTLLPHDSKYFSTIQIPIELIANASCHRFQKFLVEVFQGDEERIIVAQEWAGYILTTATNAQKALVLLGEGENGKGVFIDTLSLLLGEDNISNIPLNELNKGFSRVCLYNKTANISGENEMNGKSFNTQYFKSIVGEDSIVAEEKNKPVFSFKPTSKLIITMNNLPDTRDTSHGYFRRLSILAFNASFTGEKRDNHLKEKLKEELPGIFLWAMDGLKRLRDNDYKFSKCASMDNMLKNYQATQKPMCEFFEECIRPADSASHREENKGVYNAYKNWAAENGIGYYSKISAQKFWKEFESVAEKNGYKCNVGRSNTFRYHMGFKVVGEYKAMFGIRHNNISIDDEMDKL